MSENVFLVKLFVDNSDEFFQAKCTKLDEDFHLILLQDSEAFHFSVEKAMLDQLSKSLKIEDLLDWAVEAFTTTSKNFVFLKNGKKIVWKKAGSSDERKKKSISIKLGTFDLQNMNFSDAQREIFDASVEKIQDLTKSKQELEGKVASLSENLTEYKKTMEEFREGKETLEKSLFRQFIPILESKHGKIEDLEEELVRRSGNKRAHSDDDYGSGTDVDEDEANNTSKRSRTESQSGSQSLLEDSQNILNI